MCNKSLEPEEKANCKAYEKTKERHCRTNRAAADNYNKKGSG